MFENLMSFWFRGDAVAQAIGLGYALGGHAGFIVIAVLVGACGAAVLNPEGQISTRQRCAGWVVVGLAVAVALGGVWTAPNRALKQATLLREALRNPDRQIVFSDGAFHVSARYKPELTFMGEPTGTGPLPQISVAIDWDRAARIEKALKSEGFQVAFH